MKLNKEQFLKKYNIDETEFNESSIDWEQLLTIYEHYISFRKTLLPSADTIANILRTHQDVHSIRTRIKDPEHLIHKIIRKSLRKQETDPDYIITVDNYHIEITDLIGVRVLHLYKDQASRIDEFIRDNWDLKENCTVYHRKGDYSNTEEPVADENFDYKVHPAGYRSWHYLISSKITRHEHITEIQVRTIFEEGWSEIDHQLRYPNEIDNSLLTEQLLVLNRIAGSADEMANSIRATKININQLVTENLKSNQLISELKEQLETVLKENEVKDADRQKLEKKVKELEASKYSTEGLLGKGVTISYLGNTQPLSGHGIQLDSDYTSVSTNSATLLPLRNRSSDVVKPIKE